MSSRVGRKPIEVPKSVEIADKNGLITIKGKLGELTRQIDARIKLVTAASGELLLEAIGELTTELNSLMGTTRALLNNMVQGVHQGFQRKLLLVGVGYRCQVQGSMLQMNLGFSHPIQFAIPEGIKIETPSQTELVVSGVDKCLVGQVAADIRSYRPPEPYKGKGVRYSDEVVVIKETKK